MFPIGFSGKPGAKHRSAARSLKDTLLKKGYTVTWESLTSPLVRDTTRVIDFIRQGMGGQRGGNNVLTSLSDQEQFSLAAAAQLQVLASQDLGEAQGEHGYPLDNQNMLEATHMVRESRVSKDKGFYLRQTLGAADLSADFLIVPDVRSPHEAEWFADNGIMLRFLPVTQEADPSKSLDELEDFKEFYGRFKITDFQAPVFVEELEKIMGVQFAFVS